MRTSFLLVSTSRPGYSWCLRAPVLIVRVVPRSCYSGQMPRQNRSISIPDEISQAIDEAAQATGVTPSAWMVEAARQRLAVGDGLAAMDEYFAMAGLPSDDDVEWAEGALRRAQAFHAAAEMAS